MKTILLLFDSLNKNYISPYNKKVNTPNFQRLADKCTVFDSHFVGSLPCIPARRDILTGRKEFLWKGWGFTEPFDITLQSLARKNGIETAMITDHYHYWNGNEGYGYTVGFDYLDYIRGTECDAHGYCNRGQRPKFIDTIDNYRYPFESKLYYRNAQNLKEESDFTTPKVFFSAIDWMEHNHDLENYFLMIEEFDPHEPFYYPDSIQNDCGQFNENYSVWPPYQDKESRERFNKNHTEEEVEFIRRQYSYGVQFVDKYLGKLLDVFDKYNVWEDTTIILTTDHGHDLYENGQYGKSYPYSNNVANIPLMIYHPKVSGGRRTCNLSTQVDIYATISELITGKNQSIDGVSLLPTLFNDEKVRDEVTFGIFGKGLGYVDDKNVFITNSKLDKPLYWYSTHPKQARVGVSLKSIDFKDATSGKFIPDVDMPVWKIPCCQEEAYNQRNMIFSRNDIDRERDLLSTNPELLKEYQEKLKKLLEKENAPKEVVDRLI